MKKEIEIIARALIVKQNKILLCQNLEKGHYYLPGGHVEIYEDILSALKREFYEETGHNLKISKFLGVLENFYKEEGEFIHEINLIFQGKISENKIKSKEDHIGFFWVDIRDLRKIKLLPVQIKKFIKSKKPLFLIERNV